jgi:hypothetical protein
VKPHSELGSCEPCEGCRECPRHTQNSVEGHSLGEVSATRRAASLDSHRNALLRSRTTRKPRRHCYRARGAVSILWPKVFAMPSRWREGSPSRRHFVWPEREPGDSPQGGSHCRPQLTDRFDRATPEIIVHVSGEKARDGPTPQNEAIDIPRTTPCHSQCQIPPKRLRPRASTVPGQSEGRHTTLTCLKPRGGQRSPPGDTSLQAPISPNVILPSSWANATYGPRVPTTEADGSSYLEWSRKVAAYRQPTHRACVTGR